MRFSLVHLLILFPAWGVAYLLAPYASIYAVRASYHHDIVAADIRGIRIWAQCQYDEKPEREFEQYDVQQLWSEMGGNLDIWGNEFQLVELNERGIHDFDSPFHVYSYGADGKSNTNGNDLDDINSWNYDRRNFYGQLIANEMNRKNLWRTLWLTPVIYLFIWFVLRASQNLHRIAK